MSASGLKQLAIEHLRGSLVRFILPFETGKKLTVVYGENAAGKSTICDALEFLGKGKVGSLENRGLGKTTKYWPSVGKSAADVSVTLETQDKATCRASLLKGEVVVHPAAARPQVEVLHRSQILALVEAKPADRYAAISRFIDVSGVEASEAALRQLTRDLTGNSDVALARVRENLDAIIQFWEAAGKPASDPLSWANTETQRDPNAADAEVAALTRLQTAYSRLADYPARLNSANQAVALAKQAAIEAERKAQQCVQTIAADAGEVMGVLQAARAYLQKHPAPAVCPLCESAEKVAGLDQRITQRLASFSTLQSARDRTKEAEAGVQRAERQVEALRGSARQDAESFEKARAGFAWSPEIPMPAAAPQDIESLEAWLAASAHLSARWKSEETARQDRKQFLGTLRRALKTYGENVQARKELAALLPKLGQALKIVEQERRAFTDSILARIAGEVGRIYELVHPGEGLNKITLELDPAKRASLSIGAEFCGGNAAPPQAYFSESHLDTLGLCVFLALAALDGPENTILVLDDVLTSVDEPHAERLVEMLSAEAIKFRHCLITTHYRPWKEKLRWGWLKNGQCQFIELDQWTAPHGMKLIRSIPDVERLRALLKESPPDPQLVCATAGIVLEAALDFLTHLYECPVPRRAGGLYTLGDLLPAIDKKLRAALQVEILTQDGAGNGSYSTRSLTPILDELLRIAQTRNVFGCHFNRLASDLLEGDALSFGQNVLELIEALADPAAGWPRNCKSGQYWTNSGETRRLHPLRQPT